MMWFKSCPKCKAGDLHLDKDSYGNFQVEDDDTLSPIEDFKDALMSEYLAVGQTFDLTERDLIVLIFRGLPIPEYC